MISLRRLRNIEQLSVNGKVVSTSDEVNYFRKWAPPLQGKRVLMGGLGFGNDAKHALAEGVAHITVLEKEQEIIDRFVRVNPLVFADYRLRVEQGDWYNRDRTRDHLFDYVMNTISDYKLENETCLPTIK